MKRLLIIFTMLTVASVSFAQNLDSLNAQYAKVLKQVKRKAKAEKVELRVEPDGLMYIFYKEKRSDVVGVANLNGDIIGWTISEKYLKYYPAREEGISEYDVYNGKEKIWHPANKSVLRVGDRLFDTNLNLILEKDWSVNDKLGDNYLLAYKNFPQSYRMALFTIDGKQLTDYCYDSFYNVTERRENSYKWVYEINPYYIMTHRETDGIYYYGVIDIRNISDSIPCVFLDIKSENGKWLVKNDPNGEFIEYVKGETTRTEFRDDGEKYWTRREYDKVVEFYSNYGISKPWAKFYTACAIFEKTDNQILSNKLIVKYINEDKWNDYNFLVNTFGAAYYNINFEELTQSLLLSRQMLESYLSSPGVEEKYAKTAEVTLYSINTDLENIKELKISHPKAFAKVKAREDAAQQAAREAEYARQRQQAAFWGAMLQGFANAMSSMPSSSTVTISNPTSNSTYVAPASSSSSTTTSSYSSSSSSSSNVKTTRKCEACQGTGKIFFTSTVATYGNDKKVICPECGKEHWQSNVHHHRTCSNCHGTGQVTVQ